MDFSTSVKIAKAIEYGILSKPEDLPLFTYGHHDGPDALNTAYRVRLDQPIPNAKNIKKIGSNIISSLMNGYYNGKSLDSIVKETTRILGERVSLLQLILDSNISGHFLTKDRTHALPTYVPKNIDLDDPRFEVYEHMFDDTRMDRIIPRTREEFLSFIETKLKERGKGERLNDLDAVLHFLFRKTLI